MAGAPSLTARNPMHSTSGSSTPRCSPARSGRRRSRCPRPDAAGCPFAATGVSTSATTGSSRARTRRRRPRRTARSSHGVAAQLRHPSPASRRRQSLGRRRRPALPGRPPGRPTAQRVPGRGRPTGGALLEVRHRPRPARGGRARRRRPGGGPRQFSICVRSASTSKTITDADIAGLEVPTGIPYRFRLDDDRRRLRPSTWVTPRPPRRPPRPSPARETSHLLEDHACRPTAVGRPTWGPHPTAEGRLAGTLSPRPGPTDQSGNRLRPTARRSRVLRCARVPRCRPG